MSMQNVASHAMTLRPPDRNSLAHVPGDEGWPIVGRTFEVLADPRGQVEKMAAAYGLVYRSKVLGETSISPGFAFHCATRRAMPRSSCAR